MKMSNQVCVFDRAIVDCPGDGERQKLRNGNTVINHCATCGWNPDVEKARIDAIRRCRLLETTKPLTRGT